jgi:hypothetical protein
LQAEAGLVPGGNGFHSTNAYVPVAMPWTDAVLDGERNWDLDSSPLDWVDNMPINRMRSMSVAHNWGVPICWMANMDSEDASKRDAAKLIQAQWVWMHDSWRNPYIPQQPVMPGPVLDWGVNDAATVYHPYWRNPFVTGSDDDVLVSLWQLPNRVMLGVFNYSKDKARDISIKVDLAKLGLGPEQVYARQLWAESAGEAALDAGAGVLRVKGLPGHRVILIGLAAPAASELERAAEALPTRLAGGLPPSIADFGLVNEATKHFEAGQAPAVSCGNPAIQVAMWQLPDRVLLAVQNTDEKATQDAVIEVDLDTLGLTPRLPWQEFVGVRDLWKADDNAPAASLDFYGGTVAIKGLAPHAVRLIGIRRY